MRRITRSSISLLAIAVAAALAIPATASGAQTRNCGNNDGSGWTSRPVDAGIYNLTARGTVCRFARWLAFNAFTKAPYNARTWTAHGWTCRYTRTAEYSNFRCRASGDRLVRWERSG